MWHMQLWYLTKNQSLIEIDAEFCKECPDSIFFDIMKVATTDSNPLRAKQGWALRSEFFDALKFPTIFHNAYTGTKVTFGDQNWRSKIPPMSTSLEDFFKGTLDT